MQVLASSTLSKARLFHVRFSTGPRRASTAKRSPDPKKAFQSSVLLPKASFPVHLWGKKRLDKDRQLLSSPAFSSVYARQRQEGLTGARPTQWVLHDGPPYANGEPHLGHAINKVQKDILNRWNVVKGNYVHYRPGWDCHGLPIEHKVKTDNHEKDDAGVKELTPLQVRQAARRLAELAVDTQRAAFSSWGIMADWNNPYLTLSPDYVKFQLRLFGRLVKEGKIFRSYLPIHWSPGSRTGLAESELEYDPEHRSTSAYVSFKVERSPDATNLFPEAGDNPLHLLVWTTTPWSLTANRAISVNPEAAYSLVKFNERFFIVSSERLKAEDFQKVLDGCHVLKDGVQGSQLLILQYCHPLSNYLGDDLKPVVPAAHVTMTAGTGLVHTAPAHGKEDFLTGLEHGLDLSCHVTEEGRYSKELHQELRGLRVLGEGSTKVLKLLGDSVVLQEEVVHSYPCDWRTKEPVILRASKQWFLDVRAELDKAEKLLEEEVQVYPEHGKSELVNLLHRRPYWCLSRQRAWGTPIPAFYDKKTGDVVMSDDLVERCCHLVDKHGTDFWWKLSDEDLLHDTGINYRDVMKSRDILDVWFDSGISWSCIDEDGLRSADLYLEGLDQFSGWFYSSLMASVAARGCSPFKNVLVHGFALDSDGRKMSKSIGNVVSPLFITGESKDKDAGGADLLRYFVASHASQPGISVNVSSGVLKATRDDVIKVRKIVRFLLGNLFTLKSLDDLLPVESLVLLDRLALHKAAEAFLNVSDAYDHFKIAQVSDILQRYINNDLSANYILPLRDRLYCDALTSHGRKSAVTALWYILRLLKDSLAPIMPFLAEEIRQENPRIIKDSFELSDTTSRNVADTFINPQLAEAFRPLQDLRQKICEKAEGRNHLGDFDLHLEALNEVGARTLAMLEGREREFLEVAAVKSASSLSAESERTLDGMFRFHLEAALGRACPRCRLKVVDQEVDELCSRCRELVGEVKVTGEEAQAL